MRGRGLHKEYGVVWLEKRRGLSLTHNHLPPSRVLQRKLADPRICVEEHATLSRLGVVTKPILCTHRRRRPRICVVDQQASLIHSFAWKTLAASNFTRPTHRRGRPRICVVDQQASLIHAFAWKTLAASNFTRPTHRRGRPRICVVDQQASLIHAFAWKTLAASNFTRPTHRRGRP
ncbi:hypothetical protein PIB30_080171, partial [Stylosanthes scabra]|nr:hypothetical protein [Stylosanthes scabra]